MPKSNKTFAIVNAITGALACASSVSLVNSALAKGFEEIRITTTDGTDISISSDANGVITSGGKIVDSSPSGTFSLRGGQRLTLDNGKIVGGSAEEKRYAWAAFALKPTQQRSRASRPVSRAQKTQR